MKIRYAVSQARFVGFGTWNGWRNHLICVSFIPQLLQSVPVAVTLAYRSRRSIIHPGVHTGVVDRGDWSGGTCMGVRISHQGSEPCEVKPKDRLSSVVYTLACYCQI